MAGDWIKVDHTLPGKPEIDRIAAILGIDHDAVVGKLVRFWIWADQQSINGCALSVTETFIDRVADQKSFADALKKVGWLVKSGGRFSIPNFDRHNGKSAKARALAKNRMQRARDDDSATETSLEKRREENNKTPLPPKGGTPKAAGISKSDLSEIPKLRRWIARKRGTLKFENPAWALPWIVAAADKALEISDDPVGMFLSLAAEIASGDTSKVGDDRYDQAKKKLRDQSPATTLAEAKGIDDDDAE